MVNAQKEVEAASNDLDEIAVHGEGHVAFREVFMIEIRPARDENAEGGSIQEEGETAIRRQVLV